MVDIDTLKTGSFENELIFNTARSSGPGGQHVNKTSTKVELRFNIPASELLNDKEKETLLEKLKNKINKENELIIVSQSLRSQQKNKEEAIDKFYKTIAKALTASKKRIKTIPSAVSKEKRLEEKHKQSEKKERRKPPET